MKYAKALLPSPNSHAIVGLGGGVVPGLLRRFVVQGANSDVNEIISLCLWRAKNFAAAKKLDFGTDFKIPQGNLGFFYKPDFIELINIRIEESIKKDRKRKTAKDDPGQKAAKPAIGARRALDGPCFFGHPTTSAKDAKMKPRWHKAPGRFRWYLRAYLYAKCATSDLTKQASAELLPLYHRHLHDLANQVKVMATASQQLPKRP